jgi:hypothetical protein
VEEAKKMYDLQLPPEEFPSYMASYDSLCNMCEEQREIYDSRFVQSGVDAGLSGQT